MVAIGEFELAVLKAVFHAGGEVHAAAPGLKPETQAPGDPVEALAKLQAAGYLEPGPPKLVLSELAEEYLEALGLMDEEAL